VSFCQELHSKRGAGLTNDSPRAQYARASLTSTKEAKAVFLDRDGVLIRDVHLLTQLDQVCLSTGAPEAIRHLHSAGYYVVVVTNQAVVARGLSSEQEVDEIHSEIQTRLLANGGEQIDRFYYCPHHPNANLVEYRKKCSCRKPEPGLLLRAASEFGLELRSSWMVGDRMSDIVAGHLAGCRTILTETGMHIAPPIESGPFDATIRPDYRCADLQSATQIILQVES
jgi:D-glycero-D-manno-heptose 1,7-bisphosphate phosphatase